MRHVYRRVRRTDTRGPAPLLLPPFALPLFFAVWLSELFFVVLLALGTSFTAFVLLMLSDAATAAVSFFS
jgi:hypothetical protein